MDHIIQSSLKGEKSHNLGPYWLSSLVEGLWTILAFAIYDQREDQYLLYERLCIDPISRLLTLKKPWKKPSRIVCHDQ